MTMTSFAPMMLSVPRRRQLCKAQGWCISHNHHCKRRLTIINSSNNKRSSINISYENNSSSSNNNNNNNNRREFLHHALSSSIATTVVTIPFPANAASAAAAASSTARAKGAAEYDLEYYLRDIFLGNKPEGNLPASTQSSAIPPRLPRTLQGTFLVTNLLDDDLISSIPLQELSKITKIPISSLSQDVQLLRKKVQSAFQVSHPWNTESVKDEYYFDLTCYAVWRVAATVISNDYEKRNVFARNIGERGLDAIISQSNVGENTGLSDKSLGALLRKSGNNYFTNTIPVIIDILNLFQSSGYCSGYRIGDNNDTNNNNNNKGLPPFTIFDNLDDEEISTRGGSVNCLVSIYDPATLGSALQITGEGSRFVPDFVGTTLAAAWERMLNVSGDDHGGKTGGGNDDDNRVVVSYESYFVDPVYRPNPKVR